MNSFFYSIELTNYSTSFLYEAMVNRSGFNVVSTNNSDAHTMNMRVLSCYNWSTQNWSPRTIYGSYSWSPGPLAALQMVPQTNYGAVVCPLLPHLIPLIIQRLLLFIEP